METVLFANIKKLYDNELYSCVIPTASLLSTLLQNDRTIATPELEYQLLLYSGNSYYQERRYFRLAAKQLDAALLLRKAMVRCKNVHLPSIESTYNHFSEVETRYRLAICYREMGEQNLATAALQAVPQKARTPKINMMLANFLHYSRSANTSEAVLSYKDVLRECPLALDAIEELLKLGVDGIEVNSLIVNASCVPKNIEWLSNWIKAHAQMFGRKHLEASKTFQSINENTKFHQNEQLLTLIGKCLYYHGSFPQAQHYLETALMINPYSMDALMPLAVVYEYNQKLQELDKLTAQLTNINEFSSGHWFVLAQCFYGAGKLEKASSFTHKAISVDSRNTEAWLLRGKICLQLKRHKDAISFFRAAQCLANYRFEVYKGLFHCYVGLRRLKEAQTMCALAVRYFRNSPRSYVMFARTLFHSTNPLAKKSAKKFVSKALEIDEHYAPAVALMAEVCQAEGETQQAIAMLKKQVVSYPHHKLFTMLGDILSSEKDLNGALEYYTIALSMEPQYHRAVDGVNALGQASRSSAKDSDAINNSMAQDEEWPIECDEPSMEGVELSSPAIAHDADGESDTFSDPFWQDVDAELVT
ncbi:anaphase-promoting complex subunit 7 [Teleopsis dalmanni]|uniref:anaphase-promoting complex subunit 7-like n=1 Tax=Teleopsis dalmanni TaxID=139649 RepID=UPI000D32BF7F|nr:anaphase-promoting complex subunit 7-like [Teleopsis dalmanni]XP_037934288.1 anaphase-promoting complex subunit 7-like [Teleopsis dalmanni]XP_037958288.1 anaphase-promoting complex subunit 7 [Teleopsis dalmanni]